MPDTEFPKWLDEVDTHSVGVFTLEDGECLTADVREFDMERRQLNVDVISTNRSHPSTGRRSRAIPVDRVVSYEPQLRAAQPWPFSDPCRDASFSLGRFGLLTTLFLSMIIGGMLLGLLRLERPYVLQGASAVIYTMFAVFFTFASTGTRTGKDLPPYMFTCPAVQTQVSRLLIRHLGFLIAIFAFQTLALAARPKLSDWWNRGVKGTPFEITLMFLCFGVGYVQVFTNRSLLSRAHREFSS